jgi:aspartyl-tRNA(Asn)/glutamyl-tRNA(Gln) amidotransferase subunit C
MPTSFTRADAARIAALARLELDEAALDRYARQLSDILAYAEHVQQVDTTGVEPYRGADDEDSQSALRPDLVTPSFTQAEALANAPQGDRAAGTFVVPKVIG